MVDPTLGRIRTHIPTTLDRTQPAFCGAPGAKKRRQRCDDRRRSSITEGFDFNSRAPSAVIIHSDAASGLQVATSHFSESPTPSTPSKRAGRTRRGGNRPHTRSYGAAIKAKPARGSGVHPWEEGKVPISLCQTRSGWECGRIAVVHESRHSGHSRVSGV